MYFYKKIFILFIIIQAALLANKSTVVTGDLSYYYMQRLNDESLANIPFRMLNLNVMHQNNNFDVNGNFALEYRNRKDTDFMEDSDPSDINPVLRELYLTYFLDNGEISLGKKIYTWGSVDENSPIDILNAHDNYYLLIGTSERKLGTYSLSFDYYINNGTMRISGIYSPMHNANRYPIDDNEYEFGFPIAITGKQILKIENPAEMGLSLQQSFNRGDFSLSYFRGYNRSPSFSGINEYTMMVKDEYGSVPIDETGPNGVPDGIPESYEPIDWGPDWVWHTSQSKDFDLLYSYHLTEATNLGGVLLFNDFTIRFDYGLFNTKDDNGVDEYVNHECGLIGESVYFEPSCDTHLLGENPNNTKYVVASENITEIDPETGKFTNGPYRAYPLKQKSKYTQQTFQLEIPLSDDYQINMQYFKYSLDSFSFIDPVENDIQIPNVDLPEDCDVTDIGTCLVVTPGMGAPFATISSETIFISMEKTLLDDDLKLTLSTLMDLDKGFGEIASFEADYYMGNGLNTIVGVTKVIGDNEIEDYIFNQIEDFSNIRFEIKYSF